MVSDKVQVRTTGPVNPLTHQPVKGRKRGGGIRFGEMERDSIIAHGTAFILQDRLNNCSDYDVSWICKTCGSILSILQVTSPEDGESASKCLNCAKKANGLEYGDAVWEVNDQKYTGGDNVAKVAIPFVFRYLSAELAAMNIKMSLRTTTE